MKYTNINTIFAKLDREQISDINEGRIIEWIGEALDFMQTYPSLVKAVKFLTVKDFQTNIPKDVVNIIQLGKYNNYSTDCSCFDEIYRNIERDYSNPNTVEGCQLLKENDNSFCIIFEKDFYWYTLPYYIENFTPIRLSSSVMFDKCLQYDNSYQCSYEYTIIEGEVLRFNFRNGIVAIAYEKIKTDENGYPMIPDNISVITAIVYYIRYKQSEFEFFNNQQGSEKKMQYSKMQWETYCKQAVSELMIPKSIDEMQNLYESHTKILNTNPYYNFFKTANKSQKIKW